MGPSRKPTRGSTRSRPKKKPPSPLSEPDRKTARLASEFSEGRISLEDLLSRLADLYWPEIVKLSEEALFKRCYFYDPQTIAHLCLARAAGLIKDWNGEKSFVSWMRRSTLEVLEEIDKGMGLDWEEMQKAFHKDLDIDLRTRRMARILNGMPFGPRHLVHAMVMRGKTVGQAAVEAKMDVEVAKSILDETAEHVQWMLDGLEGKNEDLL